MFTRIFFYLSIITPLIFYSTPQAATITKVLQNGKDGYTGCYDAYTYSNTKDLNYGNDENIFHHNCQC